MVNNQLFDQLAFEYNRSHLLDWKLRQVSLAFGIPNIRDIIKSHSQGWNGPSGAFARVLAQMLTHVS